MGEFPRGENMPEKRIGVVVTAADSSAALAAIEDLEKRGFTAAWMTSGSASGGDSLSVFAAAAVPCSMSIPRRGRVWRRS